MQRARAGLADEPLTGIKPLLVELNDLKRIRSAGRDGSIAGRLFRRSWAMLVAGSAPERVMLDIAGSALAAARLGDLDAANLARLGLSPDETAEVLRSGFDAVALEVAAPLRDRLRTALGTAAPALPEAVPSFVDLLEAQPRAGVTCPGRPRIVLEPAETHAEHCLMVAVYGVVLSPHYGADPATVFLAGLAHHLHNAMMPDSGFTGEVLLGDRLGGAMDRATALALGEIHAPLRTQIEGARRILRDAGTPEGRAFHAADVLDRVLQIEQYLRPAAISMETVLGEMGLVHEGPVKAFHDRVLAQAGLA